ncbi:MAG TPA: hypothetical protein VGM06_10485 [Polyangiaceae bacterium]|jgi:hypothetical protein
MAKRRPGAENDKATAARPRKQADRRPKAVRELEARRAEIGAAIEAAGGIGPIDAEGKQTAPTPREPPIVNSRPALDAAIEEVELYERHTARGRMLAAVLRAASRAACAENQDDLEALYKVATTIVTPMRFNDWDDFAAWLLKAAREIVATERLCPQCFAVDVAALINVRSPAGAGRAEPIYAAFKKVMASVICIDAKTGHVVKGDDAVLIKLLTSAIRASGIDSTMSQDPFRAQKDRHGLRVSRKSKAAKRV